MIVAGTGNYLSIVFDTEALLIFYLDEQGADRVKEMLEKTQNGETTGYLNIVNLTEFNYILQRRDSEVALEKERNLRAFGLEIVPVLDNELWRVAADIKAGHRLSLADSFAAATAKIKGAKLVTGRDEEYKSVGVSLIRLRT
jgi:predicted nucleic acid-binding protein